MLSTPYILKIYTLINLLFLILLVSNDLSIYLVVLQLISIYYGGKSIYCMIHGGCYKEVIWIFAFYFIGNLLTFLFMKNYFPKTMSKLNRLSQKFKDNLKKIQGKENEN